MATGDFPWFPFYADDFLTSRKVRTMTAEQVGVYALLMANQWSGGTLPYDEAELCQMANGADANIVRTTLERCFEDVGTGYENARLEEIRQEQIERRNRYVKAGEASGKSRAGNRGKERRSKDVRTSLEHRLNNKEEVEERRSKKKGEVEKRERENYNPPTPLGDVDKWWDELRGIVAAHLHRPVGKPTTVIDGTEFGLGVSIEAAKRLLEAGKTRDEIMLAIRNVKHCPEAPEGGMTLALLAADVSLWNSAINEGYKRQAVPVLQVS